MRVKRAASSVNWVKLEPLAVQELCHRRHLKLFKADIFEEMVQNWSKMARAKYPGLPSLAAALLQDMCDAACKGRKRSRRDGLVEGLMNEAGQLKGVKICKKDVKRLVTLYLRYI